MGTPESLLRPLTLPPGHCSPCSMQGRPWTGATLHLSPEQPHLSPVGVTFLQQRLRFTDKISRGFLSSLRPPSLCWGQVFRSLPAGATQRTKQGDQRSAVVRPLSGSLGLPSPRDVPPGTPHPTEGERGASRAVSVLPSPGTQSQTDRGNAVWVWLRGCSQEEKTSTPVPLLPCVLIFFRHSCSSAPDQPSCRPVILKSQSLERMTGPSGWSFHADSQPGLKRCGCPAALPSSACWGDRPALNPVMVSTALRRSRLLRREFLGLLETYSCDFDFNSVRDTCWPVNHLSGISSHRFPRTSSLVFMLKQYSNVSPSDGKWPILIIAS